MDLYENMTIDEMLDESITVYDFTYYGEKSVPANGTNTLTIPITSDAHFLCRQVTGSYTTLTGAAVDGGANGINFRITDEGRNIKLFNTQIPASLILSPGRARSSGVAGDPSHNLFYPLELRYPFLASSSIIIDLSSTLAFANTFKIAFFGTKFRVGALKKSADTEQANNG